MKNEIKRKIAIKDYYGKGKHIYEDQLGFRDRMKSEARSLVAREVFRYQVEEIGLNLVNKGRFLVYMIFIKLYFLQR